MSTTAVRWWWVVCLALLVASASPLSAQKREFVGPGKCTDCHDHKDEKEWSEKRDGDGKGKQHVNALNQLADAKAEQYAKAIGLGDVYDVKGTCVKCHSTVVRGSADFGISCESCHGAGKDYLKPHQEKGAYQASIPLGLKDYLKKPDAWAKECMTCHVLGDNATDAALIKAGHSSGTDFNLGTKFQPVSLHWTESKYTANQIAAIGNPIRDALARKVTAAAPTAAVAAAPPPPPATPAPAAAAPAATAPAPAAPVAAPPRTPAPVPPTVAPTPAAPAPAAAKAAPAPVAPPRATLPPAALPALPPPPPPPPPSPVIASDAGVAVPQSPAALVGALQGRIAQLLTDLLTRGVRTPVKLTAIGTKTTYRGADAELLRLQEEVIALALEALGTTPPAKPAPQK